MKIKKQQWNGLEALTFEAGGYEAMVIPGYGANLIRLVHQATGTSIVRGPSDEEVELFKARPQVFGTPLLFPPNRIADGRYEFEGRTYQYPITIPAENNYHHGIIKSQPFHVTNTLIDEGYVQVELSYFSNAYNNSIFIDFPHEFVCKQVFHLSDGGMLQTVSFTNLSTLNMPLGVGYHTAIHIPFTPGGNPADYILRMSAGDAWELSERTLPTGKRLPLDDLSALPFEGIPPTGIGIEKVMSNSPIVEDGKPYYGAIITDQGANVTVCYEVSPEFGFWTLWNNGGEEPYICPEPQTWIHNAPNLLIPAEESGFKHVAPGATWSASVKLYVKE